jgi:hypothetical protein
MVRTRDQSYVTRNAEDLNLCCYKVKGVMVSISRLGGFYLNTPMLDIIQTVVEEKSNQRALVWQKQSTTLGCQFFFFKVVFGIIKNVLGVRTWLHR